MTYREIVRRLTDAGIADAAFEAGCLAERFAGIGRASLLAGPETEIVSADLEEAVDRRAKRYPLQYLLGEWEFMGLPFEVDGTVLIPRADTEVTAERAIRYMPEGGRLLDLCTGSGCIAAAVLHYTENTTCTAVELMPETAETARRNIGRLGLGGRCRVLTGDASDDTYLAGETFDVITANPPYVTAEEMDGLEPELRYEPACALTDGGDGLSLIRSILKTWPAHLCPGGVLLIEHGAGQRAAVTAAAKECGLDCRGYSDLAGRDRGVEIRR